MFNFWTFSDFPRTWELASEVPAESIPRRIGGRDDIELRGKIGDFFTFLFCYLFSACEFLFLCYTSARHLTYELLKLNKACVIYQICMYVHETNTGASCLIKQPQKHLVGF